MNANTASMLSTAISARAECRASRVRRDFDGKINI